MPRATATAPPAPDRLIRPLRRLLRPLIAMLIRSGVTFPAFADLCRELYVEVATSDLLPDPRARTDSRVSLLTGLARKELRRLRETRQEGHGPPPLAGIGSQVIARWLGDAAYAGRDGRPLPLPRASASDPEPSFDRLVASVTTDMRARTVLDDWLAQGIVTLDRQGRVCLADTAYLPRPGGEEQLYYFARNLHDHLAAATANVGGLTETPFLERSVHYDRLLPEVAAKLEAAGRKAAQEALLEVNRQALALLAEEEAGSAPEVGAEDGTADPVATRRLNLGIYIYVADEPGAVGE